jgi:isocitrate dehydrogenase kinase/phosphatase
VSEATADRREPDAPAARHDDPGAREIAGLIYAGYRAYRQRFQAITLAAGERFRGADWLGVQDANAERLALYAIHIDQIVRNIHALTGGPFAKSLWPAIRASYVDLIRTEYNAELFETFFNSMHRTLTHDSDVSDREMFVTSSFPRPPVPASDTLTRTYRPDRGIVEMVRQIARELPFARRRETDLPWQDLDRDIGSVLRSLVEARPEIDSIDGFEVEVLRPLFYRNKGAYVVGRIRYNDACWPLALPLLLDDRGRVYIDTLICDEDELSVMFSFTRAYFMVHEAHPHALVDFLATMLPNKKRSELYSSIGLHKHGKTVFYRDLLEHLAHSHDPFIIAPGIKGMVMCVFTLPSYQTVFKIIKDHFAPQKHITREQVREKYHIVKKHDRVGRMADTQEFENLVLPRARFTDELIDELRAVAASSVEITDDEVKIRHLYTERLMTPLNLYIETADDQSLREVLDEYGNAIKQLSAANIFPGDMLLKNFGVTRHGRVVFYDYDEICYLTDVNFRAIPQPETPEQEMSAEPWYTVGPNDVFPEEFRRFLFGRLRIKQIFTEMHGELFDPAYWRGLQAAIRDGQVMDVFPYRRKKRFLRQGKPPPGGVVDELTGHGPDEDAPEPADAGDSTSGHSSAAAGRSGPLSASPFSSGRFSSGGDGIALSAPDEAAARSESLRHLVRSGTAPVRRIGALAGMARIGMTELRVAAGERRRFGQSAHSARTEAFLYVISGQGTLQVGDAERVVAAGDFLGLAEGLGAGVLVNTSAEPLVCLYGNAD